MGRDQEYKMSAEEKRILETYKPRKFSALVWAADRIAEIAKKPVTYQSADCV